MVFNNHFVANLFLKVSVKNRSIIIIEDMDKSLRGCFFLTHTPLARYFLTFLITSILICEIFFNCSILIFAIFVRCAWRMTMYADCRSKVLIIPVFVWHIVDAQVACQRRTRWCRLLMLWTSWITFLWCSVCVVDDMTLSSWVTWLTWWRYYKYSEMIMINRPNIRELQLHVVTWKLWHRH